MIEGLGAGRVGAEDDDIGIRAGLSQLLLDHAGTVATQKMSFAHDQQGAVMPGNDFVFHYLGVPLLAMSKIGPDVFAVLHFVPVDVGITANHAHRVLSATLRVAFSDGAIKPAVNR